MLSSELFVTPPSHLFLAALLLPLRLLYSSSLLLSPSFLALLLDASTLFLSFDGFSALNFLRTRISNRPLFLSNLAVESFPVLSDRELSVVIHRDFNYFVAGSLERSIAKVSNLSQIGVFDCLVGCQS